MVGDAAKFLGLTLVLAACLLTAEAGPCHSRPSEPAPVIVLAVGPGKYVIKAGDTVNLLALRHGVPAAAILRANPGLNPARMPLGKEIIIPVATKPGTEAPAAPTVAVPAVVSSTPAAGGLELRPEKAPQATPPLGGGLKSHDLVDGPAKTAVTPAPRDAAQPEPAKPAAQASPANEADPRRDREAGPMPPVAPGWPVWGIVGGVGLVAALVLVLQGVLGNLAAGLTLRVLRPFRPGDAVMLAGIAGRVEGIGGCYVAIRSEAGETVFVPNAKAAGEIVVVAKAGTKNAGKRSHRD
ncbi:mechanosensitive ion channel domain-containing protein [Desulfovibrio sp. TomC]|uniref:mechanosensitive ion channel domain-containing protein n=1 Tax=Desulfovibrio sp. TomC TaxID=1562888 RepID=UPI0005741AA8|nr:mechanosensitive ion channel domain-containing protein [Desulfovibrio sp. TomC]KHK02725.1 Membrane-bound lytic murein transglycosylase D precursor [Desulfovibrio sp. TomC]